MNQSTSTTSHLSNLSDLKFYQDFASLPNTLYSYVSPAGIENPKLVIANHQLAQQLQINPESLEEDTALQLFSGNQVLPSWQPLAMKYTGHQFGHYNPDLGDGRGLLLADCIDNNGIRQDLHLKGAGPTPYSRFADGRAVLRSSIREYVGSETMHALSIPTTRALALVNSSTQVVRESFENAAMLVRVSPSHVRFGHFEYLHYTNQHETLKQLADYVIARNFSHIDGNAEDRYQLWFTEIVQRTADLMSQWSAVGFVHGVMNTDNFSIIGETFDYGPYGFMDSYQAQFTPNHTDQSGRYAYHQQANIGYWNLSALRQALSSLMTAKESEAIIQQYPDIFTLSFQQSMQRKLGLQELSEAEKPLLLEAINATLKMLARNHFDMTNFYRDLANINDNEVADKWRNQAIDIVTFDEWLQSYQTALLSIDSSAEKITSRQQAMYATNPCILPRNYIIQQCIEAAEVGDYAPLHEYIEALQSPFILPMNTSYLLPPPTDIDGRQLSCSS
jgi:uncharacterized protein YdiU (UPF0061 family)